jgi:LPS sulfotransferase NodH
MVIIILAEPRSGSTNLANWFYLNKNFTTLFIPSDPQSKWYKSESPKDYKYNTQHLLIKEDYYHYKNFNDVLDISDKIICLYRENTEEQIESWINAKTTNNWHNNWVLKNIKNIDETNFFIELKNSFKKEYLDKNYFKISYEELYYSNGFQKIVNYLELECVQNTNFPIGRKYRINNATNKLI